MLRRSSPESFWMVLVEDRASTRRVPELDLYCDEREVPVNLPDTYDHWCGGVFMRQSPPPSSGAVDEVHAQVGLAVGDGRLVGIVSPYEADEPAIWFSIALADVLMVEVTSRHRLTERPRMITVYVPGWTLTLVLITRYDGATEWQDKERSLLQALGGSTPWRRRLPIILRLYGRR